MCTLLLTRPCLRTRPFLLRLCFWCRTCLLLLLLLHLLLMRGVEELLLQLLLWIIFPRSKRQKVVTGGLVSAIDKLWHALAEMLSRASKPAQLSVCRQHTSAYVSTRRHTSAYVSIRQHTSAQHASSLPSYLYPVCVDDVPIDGCDECMRYAVLN